MENSQKHNEFYRFFPYCTPGQNMVVTFYCLKCYYHIHIVSDFCLLQAPLRRRIYVSTRPTPLHKRLRFLYGSVFFLSMQNYSKPYLTLDEQVALLKSRGMVITDVLKAKACLSRVGYYRLSAYWHPFRQSQTVTDPTSGATSLKVLDHFKANTDFSTVMELYVYDKKLRLLVMDAIERIEIALRTEIALRLGKQDSHAHRNQKLLHGNFARRLQSGKPNTAHQDWLNRLDRKFLDSREEFARHFKTKYPGQNPPIWIVVEVWDFGTLSHFYGGMRVSDRDGIASLFGATDGQMLETWLRCLNDVRNVCAHHARLWNRPIINRLALPSAGVVPDLDHVASGRSRDRLYSALAVMIIMMRLINPTSSWSGRLRDHISSLPSNPNLSLTSAGFPLVWLSEPLWQ